MQDNDDKTATVLNFKSHLMIDAYGAVYIQLKNLINTYGPEVVAAQAEWMLNMESKDEKKTG